MMFRAPSARPRNETKAFFECNPALKEIVLAALEAAHYFSGADRNAIVLEREDALIRVYEAMVYWSEYSDLPFEFQAETTVLDNLFEALFVSVKGQKTSITPSALRDAEKVTRFLIWRSFGKHDPNEPIASLEYQNPKVRAKRSQKPKVED
ncbi:hypothetical protein [Thalassospira lucentensis]|uniref:hypothetical protein n=1 Tax=Thalassospira lucentensis TaxID=168935 RepID=UPI003AA86959